MNDLGAKDLSELAATRIFGWEQRRIPWAYTDETVCWCEPNEGAVVMTAFAWRPVEDEKQCNLVLDKLMSLGYEWQLRLSSEGAIATVVHEGTTVAVVPDIDRRRAIVRAAIRAVAGVTS